jgi:hypothetical protein
MSTDESPLSVFIFLFPAPKPRSMGEKVEASIAAKPQDAKVGCQCTALFAESLLDLPYDWGVGGEPNAVVSYSTGLR